ncbi:hypothetical protein [Paenibacillus sp. RC67]|uniref:hypothetical protein n=1 Tax=Paenibacillus sp. RC67 TaxID=3039392 RepID=UPI0024AD1859|nr:hypothetical protein [Paenibacillus sp. RC67]
MPEPTISGPGSETLFASSISNLIPFSSFQSLNDPFHIVDVASPCAAADRLQCGTQPGIVMERVVGPQ